jgi:hypothetical protein
MNAQERKRLIDADRKRFSEEHFAAFREKVAELKRGKNCCARKE